MRFTGLTGYRRGNGTVGVRNHVIVLAAADNVNPLARQLADQTPGVTCIRASFGRGQLGEDFELAFAVAASDGERLLKTLPIPGITLAHVGVFVEELALFIQEQGQRRRIE